MCVERCIYKTLKKETKFYKVFSIACNDKLSQLRTVWGRVIATDGNNKLIRMSIPAPWKVPSKASKQKKRLRFDKRLSFQAFLHHSFAEKFAEAMQRGTSEYIYVVRAVIAPRGAIVGRGIVKGASASVNGSQGVRFSSGKVVEE